MRDLLAEEPGLLEDVLDGLFLIAAADGAIHPREFDYLGEVARIFGFDAVRFEAGGGSPRAPRPTTPTRCWAPAARWTTRR